MTEADKHYYDVIVRVKAGDEVNKNEITNDIIKNYTQHKGNNYVRLWKLGNLDHRLYPSEAAVVKLKSVLEDWDGHSNLDIVWGPELNLEIFPI